TDPHGRRSLRIQWTPLHRPADGGPADRAGEGRKLRAHAGLGRDSGLSALSEIPSEARNPYRDQEQVRDKMCGPWIHGCDRDLSRPLGASEKSYGEAVGLSLATEKHNAPLHLNPLALPGSSPVAGGFRCLSVDSSRARRSYSANARGRRILRRS